MGDDLGTERFGDGIRYNNTSTGAGVGHAGFTGLGCCDNGGAIPSFFDVFDGAVLTLSGKAVGDRPRGDPGEIAGVVVGFQV
jgi:hypothetical protein